MCLVGVKSFKSSTSLLDEVYPEHNEAIAGDSLFSIQLNYKWRKIIAALLEKAWLSDLSEISLDNQDFLSALILDLYTAETINANMLATAISVSPSGSTTTSTTYVQISTSAISHTFTKSKALIRVSGILLSVSSSQFANIKIDLASISPLDEIASIVSGATIRAISCAHVYENIPAGSRGIKLMWKTTGGTATLTAGIDLLYEIIEYD